MKDIKFRAMDKEKKVFVKGMLCFGYDDFKWVLLNDNYEQILWSYNGELQQYTGLKDKNGVEIYEGDIVSTLLLNFYDKDNKLDRKTCIEKNYDFGVIEYVDYNCSFMIMRRQYKDRVTDQWNNSMALQPCRDNLEMEVIGNIYENKELLEGF